MLSIKLAICGDSLNLSCVFICSVNKKDSSKQMHGTVIYMGMYKPRIRVEEAGNLRYNN